MALNDLAKPAVGLFAFAAVASLGVAAGYLVARDPELLRRLARSLAGGVERVSSAIALSREEIADLWAEVRDEAQRTSEAEVAAPPAAAATGVAAKRTAKKRMSKRTVKHSPARPRAAKRVSREA